MLECFVCCVFSIADFFFFFSDMCLSVGCGFLQVNGERGRVGVRGKETFDMCVCTSESEKTI